MRNRSRLSYEMKKTVANLVLVAVAGCLVLGVLNLTTGGAAFRFLGLS